MTVKMLTAWNGYPKDFIGTVISPAEETRLVGIGFASFDLDGKDNDDVDFDVRAKRNNITGVSTFSSAGVTSQLTSSPSDGIALQRHFTEYDSSLFATGRTVLSQHPATQKFYGVRLMFQNANTTDVMNISGVKVAASPQVGAINNGAGLSWSQVTFSGSPTVAVPMATGSANNVVPGVVLSDFIPLASIDRTDVVGANPLMFIRTYFADSTGRVFVPAGWTDAACIAVFGGAGNEYASAQQAGDYVGTLTAKLMTDSSVVTSVAGVVWYYGAATKTMAVFGDSLMAAVASGHQSGWHLRAQNLFKSAGRSITFGNFAKGGQTLAASFATAKSVMAVFPPSSAIFYAFSPNSGVGTQAILDGQWAITLDLIRWCRERNIEPIVCTSGPVTTYPGPDAARLQAHNARTRTSLAGVVKVLDFEAVLKDPSNPLALFPAYTIEGTHYTDAGYDALAAYVYANTSLIF